MIRKIYRILFPESFRIKIYNKKKERLYKSRLNEVKRFFIENKLLYNKYKEELDYLFKKNKINVFLYDYTDKYKNIVVNPTFDENKNLVYILHNNKKLYFPRNRTIDDIIYTYRELLSEQDQNSPHYYFSEKFSFSSGDIFVDVGSAEGMISLNVIEKAKFVYLFETDEQWIEALNATFEPWKDKVVIINKFASNKKTDSTIMLDDILKGHTENLFFKMDVEGAEREVLDGAKIVLSQNNCKVSCCTYHRQNDAVSLKSFFHEYKYITEFSEGYMLFYQLDEFVPPYFRKGIIRAKNY